MDTSLTSSSYRCINNAMYPTMDNSSLCAYQSFLLGFSVNAIPCWWGIICFDVWIQIAMEIKFYQTKWRDWFKIGFIIYGWGIPLLIVIIGLGLDTMAGQGYIACSFRGSQAFLFQFGMISLNLGISIVLMTWTFIRVFTVGLRSHHINTETFRLLWFLFVFALTFTIALTYGSNIQANLDAVKSSSTDWLTCMLTNSAVAVDARTICGDSPKILPSPNLRFAIEIVTSITGILFTILWMDRPTIRLWGYFLSDVGGRCSLEKMKDYDGRDAVKTNENQTEKQTKAMSRGTKTEQSEIGGSKCDREETVEFQTIPPSPSMDQATVEASGRSTVA